MEDLGNCSVNEDKDVGLKILFVHTLLIASINDVMLYVSPELGAVRNFLWHVAKWSN